MKIFSLFLILYSSFSFAGGSTGGGNVIVCPDEATKKISVKLLDYYEAELLLSPGITIDLPNYSTPEAIVAEVLERVSNLDKNRAEIYKQRAHTFFENTKKVRKVKLPDIGDHGYVPLEAHCHIEQIAIQNLIQFPEAKKYIIREDLWLELSTRDQAGLMLHEIIYEDALAIGHKNSVNTRYMNAVVSSKKFKKFDQAAYNDLLKRIGFVPNTPNIHPHWASDPVHLPNISIFDGDSLPKSAEIDLTTLASDADGDKLSFGIEIGNGALNPTITGGKLKLTASSRADVGTHEFFIYTSDGKAKSVAKFQVIVEKVVNPPSPFFVELTPITVHVMYSNNIAEYFPGCKGPTNYNFQKMPSFLVGSANGRLTGTPGPADVGKHTFRVFQTCGEKGIIKDFSIEVQNSENFDLGKFKVGEKFRIDFAKYAKCENLDDLGMKYEFFVSGLLKSAFHESKFAFDGLANESHIGKHFLKVTYHCKQTTTNALFSIEIEK